MVKQLDDIEKAVFDKYKQSVWGEYTLLSQDEIESLKKIASMMEPTQEQIEAAAKSMKECDLDTCDWDIDALRELSSIALKAAAAVTPDMKDRFQACVSLIKFIEHAALKDKP